MASNTHQEQLAEAVRLHQAEAFDEAERAYRRVLALDGSPVECSCLLGLLLAQRGRYADAADQFATVLALDPTNLFALNNFAAALQTAGQVEAAVAAYRAALAAHPDHAQLHNNLGTALARLERHDEAARAFAAAIALAPDEAEAHLNLANMLRDLGHVEHAIEGYHQALKLSPDDVRVYLKLTLALQEIGRQGEAMAAVSQVLALDPNHAEAWQLRADLKSFAPGDPDIDAMQVALAEAETIGHAAEDQIRLEFALGKAWMDVGDIDRAFQALHAGNRHKRANLTYDADAMAGLMGAIARTFTSELMQRGQGAGDPSDRPIFIVGMPRSGTSLVEQILDAHPQIHGMGELRLLEDLIDEISGPSGSALSFPSLVNFLPGEELRRLGAAYVGRLAAHAPQAVRVVDKMPGNFYFAGLIRLILPNARIIHCRRDPLDTCVSCYSKLFTDGQAFTYDLQELGFYHRAYVGLMDHWRALLPPERFIELAYEDLVADFPGQARRLIEFCGLDWDQACLSFHESRRRIITASVNQVRKPIYRTSVGRWRSCQGHLAPLIEALGGGH